MTGLRNKRSFTLIECVLAMSLCALLVTSLSGVFKVTNRTWGLYLDRGKALQDIRLLLFRMTSEIRYAEKLLTLSDTTIEFETKYLEDNDDEVETIKYEWIDAASPTLNRSVDGGAVIKMLDAHSPYFMKLTGYQVVSDALVPATKDDATVVKIDLIIKFNPWSWEGIEAIPAQTLVYLRNMQ